jgi:hypothetical protein
MLFSFGDEVGHWSLFDATMRVESRLTVRPAASAASSCRRVSLRLSLSVALIARLFQPIEIGRAERDSQIFQYEQGLWLH